MLLSTGAFLLTCQSLTKHPPLVAGTIFSWMFRKHRMFKNLERKCWCFAIYFTHLCYLVCHTWKHGSVRPVIKHPIVEGFIAYDKNWLLYYLFLLKCKNNTQTHEKRERERVCMVHLDNSFSFSIIAVNWNELEMWKLLLINHFPYVS